MALARGDLEAAGAGSEKALDRARGAKEPHTLAPTLALRAIVLVAQGLLGEASELISEVLALRDSPVDCLLTNSPAATPIDFTWLLRDLDRETELLPALESVPSTPWAEAARAIAHGHFAVALEIVARLGLPAVEAYTRLRTAEELARAGWQEEADECLAPAVTFFRNVGATRYLTQAEELLAGSG